MTAGGSFDRSTDDELLAALGRALQERDPVPEHVVEAAKAAFVWRTIDAELKQRIFQPLKLRATSFASAQRIRGAHAHGYLVTGSRSLRDVTAVSPTHGWAAGAIVSTADDVARFYRALFSGRLLRPDLLAAMQTATDRWGLGLERFEDPCATPWGHGGAIPGYVSLARNSADGRRQMVVLVNSESLSSGVGSDKAEEAFDRLTTTANGCA